MRTPNFQILTGPTGSGKTHRLRTLEREHAQAQPGSKVLRVAAGELLALLIYSLREEVPEVFRKLPDRGFSMVLIDDLDPGVMRAAKCVRRVACGAAKRSGLEPGEAVPHMAHPKQPGADARGSPADRTSGSVWCKD